MNHHVHTFVIKIRIITMSLKPKPSSKSRPTFPSFRFSPESEEIEEINEKPNDVSEPSTPVPEDEKGETSPLKELKHKWANKWDKRSLSLDIDLRGKIINVIEDKRRVLASHFCQEDEEEDDAVLCTSTSIPESLLNVDSPKTLVRSLPSSPTEYHGRSITRTTDPLLQEPNLRDLIIQEVGVDSLDQILPDDSTKFSFNSSDLTELQHGSVPLYNTTVLPENYVVAEQQPILVSVINNSFSDVFYHAYAKYWAVGFAVAVLTELNGTGFKILWFGLGVLAYHICSSVFTEAGVEESVQCTTAEPAPPSGGSEEERTSQGWMLTQDDYDALTFHLRSTRVVFARLTDRSLTISYPHSKVRISKRRLWSDTNSYETVQFTKHVTYDVTRVCIIPDGLSRKRVWCKKYPIAVYFSNAVVSRLVEEEDDVVKFTDNCVSVGQNVETEAFVSDKPVYLFARTDREKENWYRSLIQTPVPDDFTGYVTRSCVIPCDPGESLDTRLLNTLISRFFYDFLKSERWTNEIKLMINRKLKCMRKPAFINSISCKDLDLGSSMPVLRSSSTPVITHEGVWLDVDLSYNGSMTVSLNAFVTLNTQQDTRSRMFDSDADDSGESSESDVDNQEIVLDTTSEDDRGIFFKYADSFAKSSIIKNKHVQKVVKNVTSTPLGITVEVKLVEGTCAINIPNVPSDRVWIGFRANPNVVINARPRVGEKVINLAHLTSWIKKKILLEFQRVMVMPNMMDVTIGLMDYSLPK